MAKSKSNYTKEMVAELVEAYTACPTGDSEAEQEQRDAVVDEFAEKFGFHPASIRSKLVREEGVEYIKKATLTKQGTTPEKKEAIVAEIAEFIGMTEEMCDSLAKATKPVLQAVRNQFATLTAEPESEGSQEDSPQEVETA